MLNKMKINIFLSVIWLSVQYKNTSKIKVLQMPWNLNMIFSRIFENIWHWERSRGPTTCPWGWRVLPTPWARPLPRGPTVALLHLFLYPHTSSSSHKHEYLAQARVLAHIAAIFDLLAQSSTHKTALGDCSLVCDSSDGPISFCSSALFIANFCGIVSLFLSLHVKFMMSQVILMHDIGSRHL